MSLHMHRRIISYVLGNIVARTASCRFPTETM